MRLFLRTIFVIVGAWSIASHADYFYDQGYLDAAYRTEFNSKTTGTSSNPLHYDSSCVFPVPPSWVCGVGRTTSSLSDLWYSSSSAVWNSGADFWVVSVNNEPAFYNSPDGESGILGLPNLAHKLYLNTDPLWMSTPASFAAVTGSLVGESFPRSHLIVRHLGTSNSNDPNGAKGLPFISLGAQDNRGNNSAVGAMNSPTRPHTVKFKARIWDIRDPDPGVHPDGGLWFYMYAISEWGGKQRGVFLNLKHIGDNTDWSTSLFSGMSNRWNWPIQESFFHPGVDWAYIDTEDMWSYSVPIPATACGIHPSKTPQMTSMGVDYQFEIDLRELFRCTSTRGLFQSVMPKTTVLPILGVHWGVEMNGVDGYIWASVHDMKMQ